MKLPFLNKERFLNEDTWVYTFSFIILWNLGFHILIYFPLHESPDIQTYLGIAQLHFDDSLVRQYRVLVPFMAFLINGSFGWLFESLKPWSFEGDFSLCFSFLMVNTLIMSFVLLYIFKLCRIFKLGFWYCVMALIAVLSSRWTAELAGLPLVDSLFVLSLVLLLLGIVNNQNTYLIASIFLGPWSKEAYIFMVPLILYFNRDQIVKWIGYLFCSGVIVFSFRFCLDWYLGRSFFQSLHEDAAALFTISKSFQRVFSFHGIYELFSIVGFWIFIPFIAWYHFSKPYLIESKTTRNLFYTYLGIVFILALLSGDLGRMFYLSIPVFAVWIAIGLHKMQFAFYKS
ncbi:MAG: hypothetical protein IPL42_10990 [Saprospiraceae bacterium]|nr:hypothetical protein [Saprospiraceae bacterium]